MYIYNLYTNSQIYCCHYFEHIHLIDQLRIRKYKKVLILPLFIHTFPFFMYIWVSDLYHFFCSLKIFFNISCKAGLLATRCLNFHLSEKSFLIYTVPKDNFTEHIIISGYFFFSILETFHLTDFLLTWGYSLNVFLKVHMLEI